MITRRFSLAGLALPAILLIAAGCASSFHTLQNNDRVIFLGDSITEQGVQPKGYVTLVRDSLARRLPGVEIIGAGISGNKVTDLQIRLDRDVLSKNPTVVVIYIGINDVWHWDLKNHRGTTQEQFELGLRTSSAAFDPSTRASCSARRRSSVKNMRDRILRTHRWTSTPASAGALRGKKASHSATFGLGSSGIWKDTIHKMLTKGSSRPTACI